MCEITPEGRYIYGNAAFYRMFGYGPDEVPNLTVTDILFARERADVLNVFGRVARGELSGYEGDRRYRRKDGSELFARVSVVGIRARSGATVALAAVVVDLTAWRKLEGQFREAQKLEAVGRLAGGIAHDFNNLLTAINGYGDLLLGALGPGSPHRDAVAAIRDAGTRAAGLTGQLLAFSRKAIVEPKVLDLNAVIEHTARLLRRLVGEDVVLTTVLAPNLRRVRADPTQLDQIVLNLAVNARDAMSTGGRLTIGTRNRVLTAADAGAYPDLAPGPYVEFVVSDSGTGMTDEVKARLFEPFFTTKEQGKGTGLGLAMVYGAVKTHGGHIGVESAPGAGSVFTILLPATTDPEYTPRSNTILLDPRGTETVLVVEDDDTVRGLTRLALEGRGYAVLEAAHPAAALERAERHPGPIHLLVTDVVMPGTGGRELARALCAARPGLKVLYVSGYTDDAVVRHGIVTATDAFLQKPFSPLALVRKVRAVLDGAP
ncbi:MAG: response regulator [Planctomycetes bacterium]|nr:response regulator [Planctomycetota bacterium]